MKRVRLAEWIVAVMLTIAVLVLLSVRAQHAGGLWRDECASVQVAAMPTVGELLRNFQRETFPAFFYLLLRVFTVIFGTSDAALRSLGFAVGVMLLGVIWTNSILLNNGPPLISLALLGLNTTFLVWGTTIRGYGIGSVLILLTFGLIANLLLHPTPARIAAALLAALASVQVLLYNSVLLMAISLAIVIVCFIRRKPAPGWAAIGIGTVCAISMLPYIGPFWNESRATVVLQTPVGLGYFWSQLEIAFGNPPNVMTAVWVAVFIITIAGGVVRLWSIRSEKPTPERDLILFGLLVAVISVVCYLIFLRIISYATREWYYLALLSILAGTIDFLIATLSRINWIRGTRVAFAGAALIALPFFDWPEIAKRQTNIDVVARKLEETAQPRDLIVVNPWYYGVPFNWYYHGQALWVTVPMMSDHRVHRFDLLKAKMMSLDPLDDLYAVIRSTLKSGDHAWFVGGVWFLPAGEEPLSVPPAPQSEFGWNLDAYSESWSQQIGVFLRNHASGGRLIPTPTDGPVNTLENVDLLEVEGWRD